MDGESAVQLAEHSTSMIAKNYKIYLAIKDMLSQIQRSNELSSEQQKKITAIYNKFEKTQQEYNIQDNKDAFILA